MPIFGGFNGVIVYLLAHRNRQNPVGTMEPCPPGCAPQGRISDILNGKHSVSKEIAKKLARRFNVSADLFL